MRYLLYTILFAFSFLQIYNSYGIEKMIQTNDEDLVQILEQYWQWWSNSPDDNPDNDPICSLHSNKEYSVTFLQNPFETGDTSYDCTENPIPQGNLIFFPLITSFCSQGDVGLIDKPYNQISNCALNLDRGTIKGKVIIDGNEIVNLLINNGNGIDMDKNKKIINNFPQTKHYKEIFSKEFVDILASNNTIHTNNWETDDYKTRSVHYNGVVHCDCIIIDTNELEKGSHNLQYIVSAKAEPPSPNLIADKWDFTSTTNYKFVLK
jgi:hypothetical protein